MEKELNEILNVSNKELDSLQTAFINGYNLFHDVSYFHGSAGREHYRLLMYIAQLYKGKTVYDLGTNKCMSGVALSFGYRTKVKSFDIVKHLPMNPMVPNVEWIIGDIRDDKQLINSQFIFMDVDHDGLFENLFYDHLHKIGWKGLLLLDDIHLNDPMKEFWNKIDEEKHDLTEKGHWSGTGLAVFK